MQEGYSPAVPAAPSRHSTAGQGRLACPAPQAARRRGPGLRGSSRVADGQVRPALHPPAPRPLAGHPRAPPATPALTPGSHRAEVALPPRPRPGCGSPSDLPARGWKRGQGQSRHLPVRPAARPAAASIASTARGSAGLHGRRAPSLGRRPPGLRPRGPAHHACVAPPLR